MSKRTFYEKYYKDLPPKTKGYISLAVVAGIGLVGYSIYRGIKRAKELREANKPAEEAQQDLSDLAAQGVYPTLTGSELQVLCDALVQAMDGCGTDENLVYNVFRHLRNDADVLKLIVAFGVRYYQPCMWTSPISYAIWQVNEKAYGGNLATWLNYDLSSGEINTINRILKDTGINFQF